MKKKIPAVVLLSFLINTLYAQQVKFTEYDLSNGLHVILHQDKTAPVVAISVLYHVGSKNERNRFFLCLHFLNLHDTTH